MKSPNSEILEEVWWTNDHWDVLLSLPTFLRHFFFKNFLKVRSSKQPAIFLPLSGLKAKKHLFESWAWILLHKGYIISWLVNLPRYAPNVIPLRNKGFFSAALPRGNQWLGRGWLICHNRNHRRAVNFHLSKKTWKVERKFSLRFWDCSYPFECPSA